MHYVIAPALSTFLNYVFYGKVKDASTQVNRLVSSDKQDMWAVAWQNQQNDCAPSEDSDQPRHPPSLIRVFAVRMKNAWVLSYPMSAHWRLWSDWADTQADLSHRWAHAHLFCWFCHVAAHMQSSNKRWLEAAKAYPCVYDCASPVK